MRSTQRNLRAEWTFTPGEAVRLAPEPETSFIVMGTHAEQGLEVVWVWTGNPQDAVEEMASFDARKAREAFNDGAYLPEYIRFFPASVLERR